VRVERVEGSRKERFWKGLWCGRGLGLCLGMGFVSDLIGRGVIMAVAMKPAGRTGS